VNILKKIFFLFSFILTGAVFAGEKIDKSIYAPSADFLLIDNVRGNVEIQGWDKKEILITGELDDSAKELIIKDKGHKIYIKVMMKGSSHAGDGSELKILMPKSTFLWFKGVDTSFNFHDITAGIEGRTINGDVTINNVKTKIKISTVSGDISLLNSAGIARLESINGNVQLAGSYSDASIKSMSGEITTTIDNIAKLTTNNISGDTLIQGTLQHEALIDLSSVSGLISYNVAGELNAQCELASQFGGKIENEITNDLPKKSMLQQNLNFVSGDGSGKLIINTITGSVSIIK
jgi:hypothetical protein